MAQSNGETQSRNKEVVQAAFDAWAAGTGSPFDLLADKATWTIVGNSVVARTYPDRDAFLEGVIRPFNARMRDGLKPVLRHLYADGNTVIAFFDAHGVATDGKAYANTYAWFLDLKDGKIVNASDFFDSLEFDNFWRRVAPTI